MKNEDGSICYIIGILKDIRKKINKQFGDKIKVTIKERE
jgi:citrate lyase gamma subunit